MTEVRNHRSRSVVEAVKLHRTKFREERGQTLIEGPHVIEAALANGTEMRRVFVRSGDPRLDDLAEAVGNVVVVDDRAMGRLAGTETPRGPVAVIDIPRHRPATDRNRLVAHGVSDPGNVGTMIRIAAAFGWDFSYTPGTADPWAPKTIRAGAGAHFQTVVTQITGLSDLGGHTTAAAVAHGGQPLGELGPSPLALLIGEEAGGLPPDVVSACDRVVSIPLAGGVESLNAAVAAGIIVYELSRNSGGGPGRV